MSRMYSDIVSTINMIISTIAFTYSVYKGLRFGGILKYDEDCKNQTSMNCMKCIHSVVDPSILQYAITSISNNERINNIDIELGSDPQHRKRLSIDIKKIGYDENEEGSLTNVSSLSTLVSDNEDITILIPVVESINTTRL
jgi:hypothetical protein